MIGVNRIFKTVKKCFRNRTQDGHKLPIKYNQHSTREEWLLNINPLRLVPELQCQLRDCFAQNPLIMREFQILQA